MNTVLTPNTLRMLPRYYAINGELNSGDGDGGTLVDAETLS